MFGFEHWYHLSSFYYWLVYFACWILLLECCVFILWDAGVTTEIVEKGTILAVAMLTITMAAMGPFTRDNLLILGTGFADALIGFCMLALWPEYEQWYALKWLGALALVNSCFDFGYVLNDDWQAANGWLPSFLPTAVFSWIALKGASRDTCPAR